MSTSHPSATNDAMANPNDPFEKAYRQAKETMQGCQNEKSLRSCMPCEAFIDCPIRDAFVQSVYAKLNKGAQGDFEF